MGVTSFTDDIQYKPVDGQSGWHLTSFTDSLSQLTSFIDPINVEDTNHGVAEFYYTEALPPRAISIAHVQAKPSTPSDLTDINNTHPNVDALLPGKLTCVAWPIVRTYDAVILNNSVALTGSKVFHLENQFFEITNKWTADDKPLYYAHRLPTGVNDVTVFGDDGKETDAYLIQSGSLYHNLPNKVYWVRYYDGKSLRTELLKFSPAMKQTSGAATATTYQFEHGILQLATTGKHFIRFTADNGYQILMPYNVLPSEPWYVRIRAGIRPVAPEWGRQLFSPVRPYMLATWVPGKIVGTNLVEFERKPILFDGKRYPDVLVFDKDYNFKYALDGTPTDSQSKKGYLYPWKRSQILDMDVDAARFRLAVDLSPDDLCFGFYYYKEQDFIYRDLDINPFTNPDVKNRIVEITYHPNVVNPFQNVYHRVWDGYGTEIVELSNEPNHWEWSSVIGTLVVGGSVGLNEFVTKDSRERGGGLAKEHQAIPESKDCWDLGYWDGQPFPVGGGTVVHLPITLLKPEGQFSRAEVEQVVKAAVPMGVMPVIRYYDTATGEEMP